MIYKGKHFPNEFKMSHHNLSRSYSDLCEKSPEIINDSNMKTSINYLNNGDYKNV